MFKFRQFIMPKFFSRYHSNIFAAHCTYFDTIFPLSSLTSVHNKSWKETKFHSKQVIFSGRVLTITDVDSYTIQNDVSISRCDVITVHMSRDMKHEILF